jgi:hypothetical protein
MTPLCKSQRSQCLRCVRDNGVNDSAGISDLADFANTCIPICIAIVAHSSAKFANDKSSDDQYPSCQCSQSRFYHELPQIYRIFRKLPCRELGMQHAVFCKMASDCHSVRKKLIFTLEYCRNGPKSVLGI